jgi:hypothetical protein
MVSITTSIETGHLSGQNNGRGRTIGVGSPRLSPVEVRGSRGSDRQARARQEEKPDKTEPRLPTEPADNALASEKTDPTERSEPAEPIDRTDPAEPMDRIDPVEPIDKMDPLEPMLRIEPREAAGRHEPVNRTPHCCMSRPNPLQRRPGRPPGRYGNRNVCDIIAILDASA